MKRFMIYSLILCMCSIATATTHTENCNCSTPFVCDSCGQTITESDGVHVKTISFTSPTSGSNEQNNVFSHEEIKTGTINNTDCPETMTSDVSASIYENKTITAGAVATVGAQISAEASFGVAKAAVSYSGSFSVSGSYAVEQGILVTHSISHTTEIPARSKAMYKAKFYKKTCNVSSTTTSTETCAKRKSRWLLHDHYGTAYGPDRQYTEAASAFKYTSITIQYDGTTAI